MVDGGYQGNRQVIMPHRQPRDGSELPTWQHDLNTVHKRVRARVERAFAHMKWWNILRNCRRKRDGVPHAPSARHRARPGPSRPTVPSKARAHPLRRRACAVVPAAGAGRRARSTPDSGGLSKCDHAAVRTAAGLLRPGHLGETLLEIGSRAWAGAVFGPAADRDRVHGSSPLIVDTFRRGS